jgi:hypothetical protein
MEIVKVVDKIQSVNDRLEKSIVELHRLAKLKAQAEHDYRIAETQETLKLKTEGIAITLIPSLVKGNIADKLLERDTAEALFVACRESIDILKTIQTSNQSILKLQDYM